MTSTSRSILALAVLALLTTAVIFVVPSLRQKPVSITDGTQEPALIGWMDTHTHPAGNAVKDGEKAGDTVCTDDACLDQLVATMDRYGIEKTVLFYTPGAKGGEQGLAKELALAAAIADRSDRLVFGGGGATLNGMIQQAGSTGVVSPQMRASFESVARRLVDAGAHVFGETVALHLSGGPFHPFEQVSPDNELYLLLADLAAEYDIPIDIHMDPIPAEMATPEFLLRRSENNPPTIKENLTAFERLLDHNLKAKIVWAHIGWDMTGTMTVERFRRLLAEHPNLYLQLRTTPGIYPENAPVDESGELRAEWLELFKDYPDRFVLGSDSFYGSEQVDIPNIENHQEFLQLLPEDLARRIGVENARRIYGL